ncbi:MAG: hypothetical protein RBT34_01240 [Anaerolineaceae bacterium]|nr:hypothetical protein [Anaerolineaceae bacterium]
MACNAANLDKMRWTTLPGKAFICVAIGQKYVKESRGSFKIKDKRSAIFTNQTIDAIQAKDLSSKAGVQRNFFTEAKEARYLVRRDNNEPYLVVNTDFSTGLLNLTNPDAWSGCRM